jgi:hypothetical protein
MSGVLIQCLEVSFHDIMGIIPKLKGRTYDEKEANQYHPHIPFAGCPAERMLKGTVYMEWRNLLHGCG